MQVIKLRSANDNGLVPVGRYFARLTEGLRDAQARAAALVDTYEEHERRLEARDRAKRAAPVDCNGNLPIEAALS